MIVQHLICLVGGPFALQIKAGRNSQMGRVFEMVLKLFVCLVYRFKSVLTFFSASQSLILWFKHAGRRPQSGFYIFVPLVSSVPPSVESPPLTSEPTSVQCLSLVRLLPWRHRTPHCGPVGVSLRPLKGEKGGR